MKIGILTFQNTLNYGAKFQEYALQKYINNYGKEAEVIDYINETIEENEKPLQLKKQRNIKGIVKYFLLHNKQVSKLNKFNNFTNKYIKKSNTQYNKNNIKEVNNIYDKIIVGSDQVWNTNMTKDDYTYYLDFIEDNNKKLSYAASFGFSEMPQRNVEKTQNLLKQFKELNVREEAGKDIIDNLISREANVVVDPTFLVTKDEWKKMAKDIKQQEEYIVAYMVNDKKEVFEFMDNLAKKENLKIIYVSDFMKKRNKEKVQMIRNASPEEFIGLINNAKYVITGSFHAICMSILLEKNFFYMLNDNKVNSRLINLINKSGLEDRKIDSGKYIAKKDIDYKEVKKRMDLLIKKSKDILNEMIEE